MLYSQCGSHVTLIWSSAGSPEQAARYLAECEDRTSASVVPATPTRIDG